MEELAGRRFGHLTVLEPVRRPSRDGRTFWLCRCDCGSYTAVSRTALLEGQTESCGCTRLLGRRFGWLTAVDVTQGRYLCRCACGRTLLLEKDAMLRKTSCGCEKTSRERAALDGQVSLFPAENTLPIQG